MATGIPHLNPQATESELLHNLRLAIVDYYLNESNPQNGLIADKNEPGSLSSIAAVGMGLSVYVVAVERGIISRTNAVDRTLALLRFLHSSPQGPEPKATGYKGFYYHFLDMQSGLRAMECELSTVDTAIMMAGILTAAAYFTGDNEKEIELRKLADILYRRVDWQWALNEGTTITHGWKPESGFLPYRWSTGYSEAIILYVLFFGYEARGAPFGPDDGTISPWAVATSVPFAPEIVIETMRHIIEHLKSLCRNPYGGFIASFNPTYPDNSNLHAWTSPWIFGLNEGPILMMIENYHSELIWKTIKRCPYIVKGLQRAGFRDGWLGS